MGVSKLARDWHESGVVPSQVRNAAMYSEYSGAGFEPIDTIFMADSSKTITAEGTPGGHGWCWRQGTYHPLAGTEASCSYFDTLTPNLVVPGTQ